MLIVKEECAFFKEWGLEYSRQYVAIGESDGDILPWELRLQKLVDSHDLVEGLGGLERAKLNLISSDRRLGYTHVYLHANGRYCFLDDYVDYIPDCAISIKSATQAISNIESCK
ncbi:hypothetical protein HMPREF0026_01303 [Acinetobacter junii SH205]|uniref:Uncharacterized protein n=1 Tax=Acinetobacter junii SH205 TaxID=575587 RepID=D0SJK5_ACIJU|nr:hypothetical protein HMPREF0026_01303 [Acinetobacter junii SH205]